MLYIRPVGVVDETLLSEVREDLGVSLRIRVKVLPPMPIPEGSFEGSRNQYHSTKILREMVREIPADAAKLLGLIDKDLCIPILTFVFGEAQLGGPASIVSLARLRQEFHGLPPDRGILYERLYKECLHELGHNYGLVHCSDRDCAMYLSNTVVDVDRKKAAYCRSCGVTLRGAIGPRKE